MAQPGVACGSFDQKSYHFKHFLNRHGINVEPEKCKIVEPVQWAGPKADKIFTRDLTTGWGSG